MVTSLDFELAEDMGRFFDDPLGWVMYAFPWGVKGTDLEHYDGPDEWQREVLEEWGERIKENDFNGVTPVDAVQMSVSSGHGIGKSALSSWIILFIMSTRPNSKGVVTANTGEQLKTKTWGELGKWLSRCITKDWFVYNNGKGNMNIYHKDYKDTWRADAQTCREENSEAFAGLHAADSSPWYLFDEASAVPDAIWSVAEGGLTDGEPFWFVFGNPTRNTGRFHACFHKLRHRWITWKVDSRTAKMTNKDKIEQWRQDNGEDSDFFRVRVRGEFPKASSLQFISTAEVERCMAMPAQSHATEPLVLGVDVARFGDDQSVIAFRKGRDHRTFKAKKYREMDNMQLAEQVAMLAHGTSHTANERADAIFVDGGGTGSGVIDRLRQITSIPVYEVQFGSKALDYRKYANKRAEIWGNLRDAIKDGIALEDDSELKDDLIAPEYSYDKDSRIILESKESMKSRGMSSPDWGDAVALTYTMSIRPKTINHIQQNLQNQTVVDDNPYWR